jgi:hypothetical protein
VPEKRAIRGRHYIPEGMVLQRTQDSGRVVGYPEGIQNCDLVPRSRFLGPNFRVAVTRAVYTVIPIANALALFYDCFFTRPLHIETARAKENLCRKDLEPHRNHA